MITRHDGKNNISCVITCAGRVQEREFKEMRLKTGDGTREGNWSRCEICELIKGLRATAGWVSDRARSLVCGYWCCVSADRTVASARRSWQRRQTQRRRGCLTGERNPCTLEGSLVLGEHPLTHLIFMKMLEPHSLLLKRFSSQSHSKSYFVFLVKFRI